MVLPLKLPLETPQWREKAKNVPRQVLTNVLLSLPQVLLKTKLWIRSENWWSMWMLGFFFQFYCKVLLFDGLTDLPLTEPLADQDEPLTWSSKPINFLLHFHKERSILSGGHIHQLPMPKTQDSSIQLPKNQSFPDGCFVWLLGYLYFCNDRNNYKNNNAREAAKILKAHVCVWGCV